MDKTEKKVYEVKRTIIEYYYVDANSTSEAKKIISERGNPAKSFIKSESVKIVKS